MNNLRTRLLLSHTIPIVAVLLGIGFVLVYALESRVVLVNLATQLQQRAELVADLASDYPEIWSSDESSQQFANRFRGRGGSELMLLDSNGTVLASSDAGDRRLYDLPLSEPGVAAVQRGETFVEINYSQDYNADIADVMVPIWGGEGQLLGAVRISQDFEVAEERFFRVRRIVFWLVVGGLFLSITTALILAGLVARSLNNLADGLVAFADGRPFINLEEKGPREIRVLIRTFNRLATERLDLEKARSQLLANLVHEIARPLGALQSANTALLSGADEDPAFRRELLQGMDGEMVRLKRLTDDLAGLYGQTIGAFELQRAPTPIEPWLSRQLITWQPSAEAKGLRWQTQIDSPLPTLSIDEDRVGQALGNLLSNAIKYTPAQGTVRIKAGVSATDFWVAVEDNGPGIDPEEQQQIFDAFYRSASTRRFPQGMGLGLTIANDIVKAHGGSLRVENAPEQGSRFVITLPLASPLP